MRFRQGARLAHLFDIQRQITEAREAAELEQIRAARENVRMKLLSHGLFMASTAVRCDADGLQSLTEFHLMRQRIRDGGYHAVRKQTLGHQLDQGVE